MGFPSASKTWTVPSFFSAGSTFARSPTATICSRSGVQYFCATRWMSAAVTASIFAAYVSQ